MIFIYELYVFIKIAVEKNKTNFSSYFLYPLLGSKVHFLNTVLIYWLNERSSSSAKFFMICYDEKIER